MNYELKGQSEVCWYTEMGLYSYYFSDGQIKANRSKKKMMPRVLIPLCNVCLFFKRLFSYEKICVQGKKITFDKIRLFRELREHFPPIWHIREDIIYQETET